MIKLEIDGRELEVKPGSSIIEAADAADIAIPRFCYHKKLSIAANCRMCLVEVVKAPKPLPACATPVTEGMVVKTQSPVALLAQRSVMEFLLINHPLDCPICDQGGECELQDVSMGYGNDISRFNRGKRSVKDENIGPLIATGMTRCIHCTRCVRFGEEVAGMKELGGINRGENTEIRSFLNNTVDSELSGNMIDLCPVGALTSKPYRFSARAWELQQRPTIAPHDAIGSNIYVHSLRNNLKRVVPKENEAINEVWLSDRDRFSYEGLKHAERLHVPMARSESGILKEISWDQALALVAESINTQDLITLLSPSATVEEGYLLQKLIGALGADNNIEFKLRNPGLKLFNKINTEDNIFKLSDLEKAENILILGGCPRKSMPLLNHRIRKASLAGAKVDAVNPVGYDWNFNLHNEKIVPAETMLAEITKILSNDYNFIIVGQLVLDHPDWAKIYDLLNSLNKNNNIIISTDGANTHGLYYLIKNKNLDLYNKPDTDRSGTYLLFNIEPEFDCYNGHAVVQKLKNANKVICFSPFLSDTMAEYANIVLPLAPFTETSGTFVNLEGKWQSFKAVVSASVESAVRPGWKILCALGQLLNLSEDFNYNSSLDVKADAFDLYQKNKADKNFVNSDGLISNPNPSSDSDSRSLVTAMLVSEVNCYRTDNIVRRAASLQQTTDAQAGQYLSVNQELAEKLDLKNKQLVKISDINNLKSEIKLPVIIDNKLPSQTVYLSTGYKETLEISKPYRQVIISKDR
ncbi:MAG: NADH-quinone oxidoreductase subunit NuoG [Gammaproteobacteria bacterium]|nr:NADH-quinone oxidoreductase subunit NuoG [Gammaproteobacteria bacterium]